MKLKDKVQYALDEGRMLVLGVQVLLGFELQAFVMPAYDALPEPIRVTKLVSLCMLLLAITLLLAPVARHRIVDDGRDTPRLEAFSRRATEAALLPFALALGLDFLLVGVRTSGRALGIVLGASATLGALVAWYVVPRVMPRRPTVQQSEESAMSATEKTGKTELRDKIHHVLTETRVVLPGTQALLGFQLAAVLQSGFDALPASSKTIHVVALVCLGVSVVFLMLPAAYHHIAERGEISERLHHFSSVAVLLAMVTLALALALDAFVAVRRATGSIAAGAAVSGGWLTVTVAAWFVLMLVLRRRHGPPGGEPPETPESRPLFAE